MKSLTAYWDNNIIFHKNVTSNSFSIGENILNDLILPINQENFLLIKDNILKTPENATLCINNFVSPGITQLNIEHHDSIDILLDNDIKLSIRETEAFSFPKYSLSSIEDKLYIFLSAIVHVGLIAAMAFFMPSLGLNDNEDITKDNLYMMQQYIQASAEREQEAKEDSTTESKVNDNEGGTGTRAIGEEGSMGSPISRNSNKKYAIAGQKDNIDVHIARTTALREAAEFGMIGLLNGGTFASPNDITAPWGRNDSLGNDPLSARGNMWGDSFGDSFGSNGLGLSGIGDGGGGKGEGIGLGSIGTIGHWAGLGDNQGFGNGHGRLNGGHKPSAPKVRIGTTTVTGRLPPEIVQRIVRQQYGKMRFCYEGGLRNNPNLSGRVSVRFIIGRDGAVSNVSNAGSDLPDPNVISCIISAYYGLSFPEPEGGIVTVVYPIVLSPE